MKIPYLAPSFGQVLLAQSESGPCAVQIKAPVWLECGIPIDGMPGSTVFTTDPAVCTYTDFTGLCKFNGQANKNVYNS